MAFWLRRLVGPSLLLLYVRLGLLSCKAYGEEVETTPPDVNYETENLLALRWKMAQKSVTYDGLTVGIQYEVSDYISSNLVRYSIYDGPGCSSSANFITHLNYFTASVQEDETPLGGGFGTKKLTLSTQLVPETIAKSEAYREIDEGAMAEVEYCVRIGLHDKDVTDPTAVEFNHIETAVKLLLDLQDGFSIQGQYVEAKDQGYQTADDEFFIEAFLCDANGNAFPYKKTLVQGQMIGVCVQPTKQARDVGIRMRSIDQFQFTQGYIGQEAINNGEVSNNGLTDLYCRAGSEFCRFETLLMAQFYSGLLLTAQGEGQATLQFGSENRKRQLRWKHDAMMEDVGRRLQSSQKTVQLESFPLVKREGFLSTSSTNFAWQHRGLIVSLSLCLTSVFLLR